MLHITKANKERKMQYILIVLLSIVIGLNAQNHQKFWDNKQLQMDISTKDNKPDGASKFYHKNGKLYSSVEYKNGKITGSEVKLFDKSGKLICTNRYKNAKPTGTYKTFLFQNNMEVLFDGVYKGGKFTGQENSYYKDATLRSATSYKDGKKNGVQKKYDYKGKLNLETPYKDGKKNGLEKKYSTTGKTEINYKNDLKNGESKSYYKNGKLESQMNYKNGKEDGSCMKYKDDGTLAWKGSYKNGKLLK